MQIIRSQEQLETFENLSFTKMSDRDRKALFKRVKSIAIPIELDNRKIHTVAEMQDKVKGILGNGK